MNFRACAATVKMKKARKCWSLLTLFLALAGLVGCQGLSAGTPATQPQQPQSGTLGLSGSSLGFGNVMVGAGKTLTLNAQNSGTAALTISAAKSTASQFAVSKPAFPLTIAAGSSATLSVTFTPQATGSSSGTISISSNASDSAVNLQVSGAGTPGGTLSANPTGLSFGNVLPGNKSTLQETVTNTGISDATLSQYSVTGSGFTVSGLALPMTLSAGGSATFSVNFAPQAAGSVTGSLTISSDASNPSLGVNLAGAGTAQGTLAVSPTSLNFGNVVVNSSSGLQASLQATGTAVTVQSGVSSSSEFTLSGITLPATVQPGSPLQFTVTFAPQSSGQASGTLTFTSDASNSPTVLSLSGNGTAPTQHSVLLQWNENSQNIIGYNVYRGTTSGGPYSKIDSLDPNMSYTDQSVTNGVEYYYVTTAVNSGNQESSYSNEAHAQIPNN